VQALKTESNFHSPGPSARYAYAPGDQFYDMLIQGHQGLSDEQSELMNARLVLLLANHVGDLNVLQQAITAARGGPKVPETAQHNAPHNAPGKGAKP
jgi:Protein of unknown function (DUF2783)